MLYVSRNDFSEGKSSGTPETMPALAQRPRMPNASDPELLKRITAGIALGHSVSTVAQATGIAPSTLYLWIDQGRSAEEQSAQEPSEELGSHWMVWNAVKEGEARFESRFLTPIQDACAPKPGGWQPAAWLLERRLPDRWGQKREVRVEQHSVSLSLSAEVSPDVLAELRRRGLAALDTPKLTEG